MALAADAGSIAPDDAVVHAIGALDAAGSELEPIALRAPDGSDVPTPLRLGRS